MSDSIIRCAVSNTPEAECANAKCACHDVRHLAVVESALDAFIDRTIEEKTNGDPKGRSYCAARVSEIVVNGRTRRKNLIVTVEFMIEGCETYVYECGDEEANFYGYPEERRIVVSKSTGEILSTSSCTIGDEDWDGWEYSYGI